jgi:hypothetical protein
MARTLLPPVTKASALKTIVTGALPAKCIKPEYDQ